MLNKHLSSEQVRELNPIIRNAIYMAFYAAEQAAIGSRGARAYVAFPPTLAQLLGNQIGPAPSQHWPLCILKGNKGITVSSQCCLKVTVLPQDSLISE
jgi:hypothetical protein